MALKAMSFCRVATLAALGLGGSEAATDATSFETFGEDVTKTTETLAIRKLVSSFAVYAT